MKIRTYVMVDVEANGPIPGDYSMTSLGAVIVDKKLDKSFSVNIKPISKAFDPSREKFVDSTNAIDAKEAMQKFKNWLEKNVKGKITFISDNNGFDWMFICWYFWHFLKENPMGFNSRNLQCLYKGSVKDLNAKFGKYRGNNLSHKAIDDARDNAKAFLKLIKEMELE